jgi:hypothetical protein
MYFTYIKEGVPDACGTPPFSFPFSARKEGHSPIGPLPHILKKGKTDGGVKRMDQVWHLQDPYFYQALQNLAGKTVVVQTIRGSVRGVLDQVMPDFLVVDMAGNPFHIRTQQIIWVVPGPLQPS